MRRNWSATTFGNALPGFQVGITTLKVLERGVIAKVVDIVKPAGAWPVNTSVGNAKPGSVPFVRTNSSEIKLPIADYG